MASVRRQLVKTPLGYVTYIWLEGGIVPYEVLMSDVSDVSPLVTTVPVRDPGYRTNQPAPQQ